MAYRSLITLFVLMFVQLTFAQSGGPQESWEYRHGPMVICIGTGLGFMSITKANMYTEMYIPFRMEIGLDLQTLKKNEAATGRISLSLPEPVFSLHFYIKQNNYDKIDSIGPGVFDTTFYDPEMTFFEPSAIVREYLRINSLIAAYAECGFGLQISNGSLDIDGGTDPKIHERFINKASASIHFGGGIRLWSRHEIKSGNKIIKYIFKRSSFLFGGRLSLQIGGNKTIKKYYAPRLNFPFFSFRLMLP